MADAVRRCRWIAVDLNASAFSLFLAARTVGPAHLACCFDSGFPHGADWARRGGDRKFTALVSHLRGSTLPCWWSETYDSQTARRLASLPWVHRLERGLPGGDGIGFPVQSDRGLCGLVAFQGSSMTLSADGLYDIHARCFALFDAVVRIRSGSADSLPPISGRELECLKLTANGYTSADIARLLRLSVHTTNQYLASTVRKLDAVNRAHAVAKALRLGLIE